MSNSGNVTATSTDVPRLSERPADYKKHLALEHYAPTNEWYIYLKDGTVTFHATLTLAYRALVTEYPETH